MLESESQGCLHPANHHYTLLTLQVKGNFFWNSCSDFEVTHIDSLIFSIFPLLHQKNSSFEPKACSLHWHSTAACSFLSFSLPWSAWIHAYVFHMNTPNTWLWSRNPRLSLLRIPYLLTWVSKMIKIFMYGCTCDCMFYPRGSLSNIL